MKPASGTMISNLATYQNFWVANLFTITLLDGTVLRYTDFQSPVKLSGNTFSDADDDLLTYQAMQTGWLIRSWFFSVRNRSGYSNVINRFGHWYQICILGLNIGFMYKIEK